MQDSQDYASPKPKPQLHHIEDIAYLMTICILHFTQERLYITIKILVQHSPETIPETIPETTSQH